MKTVQQARCLADSLVQTGKRLNLPVSALLTDMDQPLGQAIGNAVEVNETIDLLRGHGPVAVRDLTLQLSSQLLVAVGRCSDHESAADLLNRAWDSGSAMQKFEEMIAAQGGRIDGHLPIAARRDIVSKASGFVKAIDCQTIGECVVALGGGRRRKEDRIDPRVGIVWQATIGQSIDKGDVIGSLFADNADAGQWCERLSAAIELTDESVPTRPLVLERIEVNE